MGQDLVSIQDYATRVPGLSIQPGTQGYRISSVSLRGVASFGSSATTGMLVDDVPFVPGVSGANAIVPDFDPADLSRIEVLRGPQGTLYGASAMGGLIKYVTIDPDPNNFSGHFEVGGNHASYGGDGDSLRGMANIPLWGDKLGVRVSGFRREGPAYIDSITGTGATSVTRRDTNSNITQGGRAAIYFAPIDGLTINVSHLEQKLEQGIFGGAILTPYPTDFKPVQGYYATAVGDSNTNNKHQLTEARINWQLPFASYRLGPHGR